MWLAAAIGFAIGMIHSAARADSVPAERSSWALRGEAFTSGPTSLVNGTTAAGAVTVQKVLFRRWAWEETVGFGRGLGTSQPYEAQGRWLFAGTARLSALRCGDHGLTVGLGFAMVTGGDDSRNHEAYAEVGYEYRSPKGITALLAAGPNLSFPHHDVAVLGHARFGVGWIF